MPRDKQVRRTWATVHQRDEAYSTLACTLFKRVRVAARVLPGNLRKIHSRDLPFFHSSKRCSSRASYSIVILEPERPNLPLLEYPLSLLLRSGLLWLKLLSLLLLDSLLYRDARVPALTAPSFSSYEERMFLFQLDGESSFNQLHPLPGKVAGLRSKKPLTHPNLRHFFAFIGASEQDFNLVLQYTYNIPLLLSVKRSEISSYNRLSPFRKVYRSRKNLTFLAGLLTARS